MKKASLILASSLIILSSSPSLPARASTQEFEGGGATEEQIFGDILNNQGNGSFNLFGINLGAYLGSVQQFFVDQISDQIQPGNDQTDLFLSILNQKLLSDIRDKIGDIFGVFGYPSPNEINREIPEIIVSDDSEEVGEFTPLGKKETAVSESKRKITEAYLESRLGKVAQEQKKQQILAISELANKSVTAATDAASQNITQDVLKEVAGQNAYNSLISQAIYTELTKIEMNQNMSLQELSKISEKLEQEEWKTRVTSSANRVSLVEAITQFSSLF